MRSSTVYIACVDATDKRVIRLAEGLRSQRYRVVLVDHAGGGVPEDLGEQDVMLAACLRTHEPADHVGLASITGAATEQQRLICVLLQKTKLPNALQGAPRIDLVNWRGSTKNVYFQDLLAAIWAIRCRAPQPKPKGPFRRFVVRAIGGLGFLSLTSTVLAFVLNVLSVQNTVCSFGPLQPELSDICGALEFGGKPTRDERLAWEGLPRGSCEALAAHIRSYPQGAYHDEAADLIEAAVVTQKERWVPETKRLSMFIGPDGPASVDQSSARAAAVSRASQKARRLCSGFAATAETYRILSSRTSAETWQCKEYSSGFVCGFEGEAVCQVQVRTLSETRRCGD